MADWVKLLAYALRSLFKSRARLEAENLVLLWSAEMIGLT